MDRSASAMSKKQKRRSEVRRKSSLGEDKYGNITPHLGVSPLEFIDSVINGTCDLFCDAVDTLEENFLEVFQDADPDTVKGVRRCGLPSYSCNAAALLLLCPSSPSPFPLLLLLPLLVVVKVVFVLLLR